MARISEIVMRVRELGADLVIEQDRRGQLKLRIIAEGNLTEAQLKTVCEHQGKFVAYLRNVSKTSPNIACSECGWPNYWQADDGWRCNKCYPRPKNFMGTTCCVGALLKLAQD